MSCTINRSEQEEESKKARYQADSYKQTHKLEYFMSGRDVPAQEATARQA
jgi:hypothetical protein